MSAFSDLLKGGGIGQQLLVWGVLNQVIGTAVQPVVNELLQVIYPELPSVPLSAADAADLVLKGWWDHGAGEAEAKRTGINPERFAQLVNSAGEPIPLDTLMEALHRGVLEWDKGKGAGPSVMEGIRQSRLRDEWGPVVQALQWRPLPVSDAADALIRHQLDADAAYKAAAANGVDRNDFTTLVNSKGNPPAPMQLITLYRRGLIPMEGTGPAALSVQQGIAEGDTKDKWWKMVAELSHYVPPPRTVTALERSGVIDKATANKYYAENGLDDTLANYYSSNASADKTQKHRDLAEAQILDLYEARTLTESEAHELLGALGFSSDEVAWILSLRDVQRSLKAVDGAISRIHNLFVARKLTEGDAATALDSLRVDASQRDELIGMWKLERGATVRVLTQSEITESFKRGIMDQATAQSYLEALGYSPYDAWVLLSNKHGSPLAGQPGEGATVTGRAV